MLLCLTCFVQGSAFSQRLGLVQICNLRGYVFQLDDPYMADVKVFVEENEVFSQLLVYKTDMLTFQGATSGVWCWVKDRTLADFTIGFVTSANQADVVITYTNFESLAGCR